MHKYHASLQRLDDGQLVDTLIEQILECIYDTDYSDEDFDNAFTAIVREYVSTSSPFLMASITAQQPSTLGGVRFLSLLGMDYMIISNSGPNWPKGGFPYLPTALYAVSIYYPDGFYRSDFTPGEDLNQAALAALMQISREIATERHNQPELRLRDYDA
jgi:hypothetical protein